jgi:hypothetical protein
MSRSIRLRLEGVTVEEGDLLDATRMATISGQARDDAGRGWRWEMSLSWTMALRSDFSEGDVSLLREDGAQIFATLTEGEYVEDPEEDEGSFTAVFQIEGGEGPFETARGSVETNCRVTGEEVEGEARVELRGE